MTRAERYTTGYAIGQEWAEADLRDGNPASATLEEWAENLRAYTSDDWRAYWLGALRGYRELTRTKLAGRWGT